MSSDDHRPAEVPVEHVDPLDTVKSLAALKGKDYIDEVVEYIRQTAEAAHALHKVGVVHRDIKPGNIMIDMRGKAVLMDLGLAKLAFDTEGQLTRTRQFVGTICYAAPNRFSRQAIWTCAATSTVSERLSGSCSRCDHRLWDQANHLRIN